MNINKFQILETSKIKEALLKIEQNEKGFVCTIDKNNVVTGTLTDGDIRRVLIKGGSVNDLIILAKNSNFLWSKDNVSRENLLKKLDNIIHFIPVLDDNGRLIKIFAKDDLPIDKETSVVIRSKSPVRISFGGGGSDTTNYFQYNEGAALNTTISLYAHAALKSRQDKKIIIHSLDLQKSAKANNLKQFLLAKNEFGLIQSVLKMINPTFGFELIIYSDFKMKSGLGGSSAVVSAILGCFNEYRIDQWNLNELAELSFQAERLYFNIAGGWQDQYATVFGGLNFVEFKKQKNTVHPLRLAPNIKAELEECLILCDTNISHNSDEIHIDQKKEMKKSINTEKVKMNVQLAYQMRDCLLRGELNDFGKLMNSSWEIKKSLSNKISNNYLDKIYSTAISNGAVGGKLLGAGGGGCFLFFISPFRRIQLIKAIEELELTIIPLVFEDRGLRSWKTRNH